MIHFRRSIVGPAILAALPLFGALLLAGCHKSDEGGGPTSPPGGMGRGPGGSGGPGAVLAADATGAQIYSAKCAGCHGDQGQGVRGPSLKGSSSRPDAQLTSIIHDGKGRMPAFGTQLSADQITKVAAFVKQFPSG